MSPYRDTGATDPALLTALVALVEPTRRGNPESASLQAGSPREQALPLAVYPPPPTPGPRPWPIAVPDPFRSW